MFEDLSTWKMRRLIKEGKAFNPFENRALRYWMYIVLGTFSFWLMALGLPNFN